MDMSFRAGGVMQMPEEMGTRAHVMSTKASLSDQSDMESLHVGMQAGHRSDW